MTTSATAGADAHAAAVTAEADLAVLRTNAARADPEAPETLGHTADTGGAEVVRMTDTGHVITAADATDQPRALRPETPNTSRRAGALAPGLDRPVHRRRSCRRRPDPVRKSPASAPPPARRPAPARAPDPGPDASLEAASQRSAFKYCFSSNLCVFNHDGAAASACSPSYWIPNKQR